MGPGRECESLGRLGGMGKNPWVVSYLAADGMMGGIYRVDSTILTCRFCVQGEDPLCLLAGR